MERVSVMPASLPPAAQSLREIARRRDRMRLKPVRISPIFTIEAIRQDAWSPSQRMYGNNGR